MPRTLAGRARRRSDLSRPASRGQPPTDAAAAPANPKLSPVRDRFARIAGWCVENPIPVVVAVLLVAVIATVAALRLETDAGTDQLVDNDSPAFKATEDFKQRFGDDAVVVLVKRRPRPARAHLRPRQAALARGLPLRQRRGRPGVHRRAGAGAVRADRRGEAGAGGARRRHLPQPVGDSGDRGAARAVGGRGRAGARRRRGGGAGRARAGARRRAGAGGGRGGRARRC